MFSSCLLVHSFSDGFYPFIVTRKYQCMCFQALTRMKFKNPTPIQAATVPVALKGKDICACAATGTGAVCVNYIEFSANILISLLGIYCLH